MSWHYRLGRFNDGTLAIVEHYPTIAEGAWGEAFSPQGYTVEEVKESIDWVLLHMTEALSRPILECAEERMVRPEPQGAAG